LFLHFLDILNFSDIQPLILNLFLNQTLKYIVENTLFACLQCKFPATQHQLSASAAVNVETVRTI